MNGAGGVSPQTRVASDENNLDLKLSVRLIRSGERGILRNCKSTFKASESAHLTTGSVAACAAAGPFTDERVQGFATGLFTDSSLLLVSEVEARSKACFLGVCPYGTSFHHDSNQYRVI